MNATQAAPPKRDNLAADIPPDLADADETLTRYGRWAMNRHHKQHCGSAEGRYRTPPNDDDRQPREVLMSTPQALAVQRALARVPDRERVVLAVLYVPRRIPIEAQLRILHIPPRLCRERHLLGLRVFRNMHRAQEAASTA
jgi:hypothetical protein